MRRSPSGVRPPRVTADLWPVTRSIFSPLGSFHSTMSSPRPADASMLLPRTQVSEVTLRLCPLSVCRHSFVARSQMRTVVS